MSLQTQSALASGGRRWRSDESACDRLMCGLGGANSDIETRDKREGSKSQTCYREGSGIVPNGGRSSLVSRRSRGIWAEPQVAAFLSCVLWLACEGGFSVRLAVEQW